MAEVPYEMGNVERCKCGKCPVYKASKCGAAYNAKIDWSSGKLPDAKVIEGIYCATAVGKTKCNDLDAKKPCQCPTCPVWEEFGLQAAYYCAKGPASAIEP
jgi:hypothetical protein